MGKLGESFGPPMPCLSLTYGETRWNKGSTKPTSKGCKGVMIIYHWFIHFLPLSLCLLTTAELTSGFLLQFFFYNVAVFVVSITWISTSACVEAVYRGTHNKKWVQIPMNLDYSDLLCIISMGLNWHFSVHFICWQVNGLAAYSVRAAWESIQHKSLLSSLNGHLEF